ncbi:MAG: UDP-N-acetylglucosamine 2-epimerase (non-hydrolyzing) [Armatimonadetes bacterium]|nr:UDP-N-acetylglucosamine 2-epimerase (non-hydrolyzing) [Armatimonadota bacterium]
MQRLKIMSIFGTRPEAIKMAPVLKILKEEKKYFESKIIVTAQHREMLDQVLNLFSLSPRYDLNIMEANQTLFEITKKTLKGLNEIFLKEKPDLVLVQGDTTSAFASALSAFYHQIPVGHIEAGLRTPLIYNPFPEEMNRRLISVISSLHFAPTYWAKNNLLLNGISPKNIFLTGNTVIDAMLHISKNIKSAPQLLNKLKNKRIILVETHRRENFGKPLEEFCKTLKKIVKNFTDVEIIFSVHKNPKVREVIFKKLVNSAQIHLLEPLDYPDLIHFMKKSYFIMTDSGGIQEEAPSFGKPVLVLRKTTERPEGVQAGAAKLAGVKSSKIYKIAEQLLKNEREYQKMAKTINPYGDGKAALRIVQAILYFLKIKHYPPKEFKG